MDNIPYKNGMYYILRGLDTPGESVVSPTVWLTEATESLGTLYINGEKDEKVINTIIYYTYFDYIPYIILILEWMMLAFLFFVRIPDITRGKKGRYIGLPVVCMANIIFMEHIGMFFGDFKDQIIAPARAVTYAILFLFLICIYGISGNIIAGTLITDICYFCFVMASWFVVHYRHSPIVSADMYSIKTLGTVIGQYDISFSTEQCACIMASLLVFVASFLFLKKYRKGTKRNFCRECSAIRG